MNADASESGNPGQTSVDVLVPVALERAYTYAVPAHLNCQPGDVVRVPLGARETIGVVWDRDPDDPVMGGGNLKPVAEKLDAPPMRPAMRRFIEWIARYTLAPRGMVARMALRDPENAGAEKPHYGIRATGAAVERPTPARLRVLAAAEGGMAWRKGALAAAAGVSSGVIDALVDCGALETIALPPEPVAAEPLPDFMAPSLSTAQAAAAAELTAALGRFQVTLLEGVTGSGKTEVYFEAVAETVRQGGQVLILMPEIALTAQFLTRFEQRFGVRPGEWHSGAAMGKRNRLWREVASGSAKVIAGARSALFLPFKALGLIIVDEEHEAAYKQEDSVRYHARDMAIVRARIEEASVVLASATPSVETRHNAVSGRFAHVRLPERFGGRALPALSAIDLKQHRAPRGRWISPPLELAIRETLGGGGQALLFLNRRGYAPLTLCRACGHRFTCPDCQTSLVEHRFRRALMCHQCGHLERVPQRCPACAAEETLSAIGPGIERLAEEVTALFPEARKIALSSDFPGGTERLRAELDAVAKGEFRLVIGTQLVAKGHNFPLMTLAAVIDADLGLMNGDPRAAERTWQLLQQVTGRAGRGDKPGRGILQTYQPEHPVIRAILSGDTERFYAEETASRQAAMLPPFGRLAGVIVSGADKLAAEAQARAIAQAGHAVMAREPERFGEIALYGPVEAPIAVIRGRFRFRLLAKAPRETDMQGFLRLALAEMPKPRGSLRVDVDIDPISFV